MDKKEMDKISKLSPKVQIRYNNFVLFKEKKEEEGYITKDLTINPILVNILAIFISIPILLICVFTYLRFAGTIDFQVIRDMGMLNFILVYFPLYTLLTIIHELIHGLCWGICAKDHFKKVEFGIFWKYLTPYCTIQSPLKKWQYILGTSMPTIVLGIIPFIFSIIFASTHLFIISIGMILGGVGDLMVLIRLLCFAPRNKIISYIDHPYKCGLVAFIKDKENK
jgi:ABC-type multidrug transport system permease subunit